MLNNQKATETGTKGIPKARSFFRTGRSKRRASTSLISHRRTGIMIKAARAVPSSAPFRPRPKARTRPTDSTRVSAAVAMLSTVNSLALNWLRSACENIRFNINRGLPASPSTRAV